VRIAFDLDDTLILYGDEYPTEPSVPHWLRPWFGEPLRAGTRTLLRELQALGCDIWVYTTSGRGPAHLRLWFLLMGVPLGGVVNCDRHEALMRTGRHPKCTKYPPAYNIDLLVDDSDWVAREGSRHGFEVLLVSPDDTQWAERVLSIVRSRHR
jgi:hypothetical protein